VIKSAVDLLRLIFAYCLGDHGLRLTAAWATSMGLVDISAPALLYRLRLVEFSGCCARQPRRPAGAA
jgi:hypothetical protein